MNQSLTTTSPTELQTVVDENLLVEYLDAMGLASKLNASEKKQFLQIALNFKLNPFKREIYAIKYGSSALQIVVGYEVYLKRAELSGRFDGVDTAFYEEGNDTICQVTIYRKDWTRPLVHRVYMSEYNSSSNPLWKQKPKTMLRKVAVSQAYRMAFPVDFDGMPYTRDEMEVQDTTAEVVESTPTKATRNQNKRNTAEAMKQFQETGTLPESTGDPVPDEKFVFDRIDEFTANIQKAQDNASWDWNEEMIADDNLLPLDEKQKLIKASILHRLGKSSSRNEINTVFERLKKYKGGLGPEAAILFNDFNDTAAANGLIYNENAKCYDLAPAEELANNG